MQAADGKLRYTDVLDAEGIAELIQACPSPKAEAFKIWLKNLARKRPAAGEHVSEEIFKSISKVKHIVGNMLRVIVKKEFCIFTAEDTPEGKPVPSEPAIEEKSAPSETALPETFPEALPKTA
jgi:hypothetical protein